MSKPIKKKKKLAKGKQVARPASKKPRPKKQVEPKLQEIGKISADKIDIKPEPAEFVSIGMEDSVSLDAAACVADKMIELGVLPRDGRQAHIDMMREWKFDEFQSYQQVIENTSSPVPFSFSGELNEKNLNNAMVALDAVINKTDDTAPPVVISVELPPGKTEADAARAIKLGAESLEARSMDSKLYRIAKTWGESYSSGDIFKEQDNYKSRQELDIIRREGQAKGIVEKLSEYGLISDKETELDKAMNFISYKDYNAWASTQLKRIAMVEDGRERQPIKKSGIIRSILSWLNEPFWKS